MTEGVVLKLSTEAASRGMREFEAVTKATLDTLSQQNRVLSSLEQTFRRQADAEAAATRAAEAAAAARKKAADALRHDQSLRLLGADFGENGHEVGSGLQPRGPPGIRT